MKSVLTVMSASIVALTLSVLTAAQITADSRRAEPAITAPAPRIEAQQAPAAKVSVQSLEQKSCADPWRPQQNSEHYWRWHAYHNLDCAIALIDEHIGAPGASRASTEDGTVSISRGELERLRTFAMMAKDAAMRIGR